MSGTTRGSIAFFATYRPPVPLDIFSCSVPPASKTDEVHLTDGQDYNYNGQAIPKEALKTIVQQKKILSSGVKVNEVDVDSGRVSGMVFVSERENNLETLHMALRFNDSPPTVKVFNLSEVYEQMGRVVRMEDSGCFAGGYKEKGRTVDPYLVYVSTKNPPEDITKGTKKPEILRGQPWTAVYKTNLRTGKTDRLSPRGTSDLSPSVSPSGRRVAVASFEDRGWLGEIENLKTDIYVMNIEGFLMRRMIIKNGGWPTWGSDDIIFFHRKENKNWGVFRADVSKGKVSETQIRRVTPITIGAMTPAAIDATKVVVATVRQSSTFSDLHRNEAQHRHIEIFDSNDSKQGSIQLTQNTRSLADHFNPFVIDGGKHIGYHRCKDDLLKHKDQIERNFNKVHSPHGDVGLFRVSGVFPAFSPDGSKLAFVDNEFNAIWLADSEGLRIVASMNGREDKNVFAPVWNQNPKNDILYVCVGYSFHAKQSLEIHRIKDVSKKGAQLYQLTAGANNAFPSTNPEGTKIVYRSTRDHKDGKYKNLYIMEDEKFGEDSELDEPITRVTTGEYVDTHCQWSPNGEWIVFSSTRDAPQIIDDSNLPNNDKNPDDDMLPDAGNFCVHLVLAKKPFDVVRVIKCGDGFPGHVNHPFFSPDGKTLVVTGDLAAISADPISLPLFVHSVRPYGDIFSVELVDMKDINKNKDIKKFTRITHSRYENSTPAWTMFSTDDPNAKWKLVFMGREGYKPACPYMLKNGGQSWHMTGHLVLPRRCC